MMKIAVDRIVPMPEASERLSEIVSTTFEDNFWVIVEGGKPKVAVVDLKYLNNLVRRVWFDDLSARTHAAFREYLIRRGLDPDTLTEEEVEAIIHG